MNKPYILILGSSGLIGKKITTDLLNTGKNVIGIDLKIHKSHQLNKNFKFIKKNLKDEKSVLSLFSYLQKRNIIINCVVYLIYPKSKQWGSKFGTLKLKYLNQDLSFQLGVQIFFLQELFKYFLNFKIKGKIVLFSSIQGIHAPKFSHYKSTNMSSPIEYSAIKSGIITITKYLAKYYKGKKININCISPGGIKDNQNRKFIDKYKKDTLNKGLLDSEDICGTIKFLISKDSEFINGQNIIVDDGWSL
tara:strand:- start:1567 stop:2310 length:744 start_codon:yes stop_codon:yes gene_type:complete